MNRLKGRRPKYHYSYAVGSTPSEREADLIGVDSEADLIGVDSNADSIRDEVEAQIRHEFTADHGQHVTDDVILTR